MGVAWCTGSDLLPDYEIGLELPLFMTDINGVSFQPIFSLPTQALACRPEPYAFSKRQPRGIRTTELLRARGCANSSLYLKMSAYCIVLDIGENFFLHKPV